MMKQFKHEFAETMRRLGESLKVKWTLAVILTLIIAAVRLCGGNHYAVARFTLYYCVLICIESLAVGVGKLCSITTDKHQ